MCGWTGDVWAAASGAGLCSCAGVTGCRVGADGSCSDITWDLASDVAWGLATVTPGHPAAVSERRGSVGSGVSPTYRADPPWDAQPAAAGQTAGTVGCVHIRQSVTGQTECTTGCNGSGNVTLL